MAPNKREQRAEQIVDATADLILRWGAKRVTIDEVAKHAGIGKGTVYLHFSSRARLLACVLMRESRHLVDALIEAIRRDPTGALPAEQARLTFLEVQRRPLLLAMFVRDSSVLGELAHESAVEPLRVLKNQLATDLFELLREHGLMRTDQDIATQRHIVSAIQTGFYLYQAVPGSAALEPDAAATAMCHTIAASVQSPAPPDPTALAAVAPAVLAGYQRFRTDLDAAITAES
jgi:AcrR family transcriptional regulator